MSRGSIASAPAFCGERWRHSTGTSGQTRRKERLACARWGGKTSRVSKSVFEREDVDAILRGLWDIKILLVRIVHLLGNDEEEEER